MENEFNIEEEVFGILHQMENEKGNFCFFGMPLSSDIVSYISVAPQFNGATHCDFSHSSLSYDDIRAFWKSKQFGRKSLREPFYCSFYNQPVRKIVFEVDGCPIIEQYEEMEEKGRRILPLPFKKDFEFSSVESDNVYKGFKEIILEVEGKEWPRSR
nr:hypothetical protein pmam_394 [Pithovirus mammoth]